MNQILIVEDNSIFSKLLIDLFEMWNPEVRLILARNGEEGVNAALKHQPDLILMDGQMPVMDGVSAARTLRSQLETKDIPLIGMTAGHGEFTHLSNNLSSVCNHFLAKPFSMRELITTIEGLEQA